MIHAREDYNRRVQDNENVIPEDEPVFLIRAQDHFSFAMLEHYSDMLDLIGKFDHANLVRQHAEKMRLWPIKKLPDTPGV